MNKTTYVKYSIIAILLLLGVQVFAQNLVPFSPRYDQAIKGDMLLIGNSNVGIHVTNPYNGTNTNDRLNAAVHVDVDSDPTTFNSSTADLDVPDISGGCYQIVHASLYWSAVVNGSDPISDIKFRTPGSTSYVDITGTQVYYQNATSNSNSNVYVYHHDVTDIITALPNAEGTYGVANISSLVGPKPNAEGLSAGWSLFVIYEDPTLTSKYITSFDGFTRITSTINETFPISGFQTIPTGPVRAKFAFSTIEGDQRWTGDYLQLNGVTIDATNNAGNVIRPSNNFFNSTVSIIDPINNTPELFFDRNPAGTNTLGFDAGIINVPNAGNTVIGNGDTSASIRLGSNLDIYYYYFSAFSIEIIAPNIVLTKLVFDEDDNDAEGQTVDLGDQLTYVIGFENTGNDDATNFTIRDILPVNIVFNFPADLELLPSGVTVQSYNPATREIIFAINNSVVEEGDPRLDIRFNVRVVETCSLLDDACSNIVDNQAYATYQGTINSTFTISDDPSFNTNTGCLITPRATNFLADLDCEFREEVVLCGDTVELTAGSGYDSYSWSTSPSGTPVIGTGQSITVNAVGTYYVHNEAIAPCQDIDQIFDVITYGAGVPNPVIPFADQVVICPNDGVELPNFFLCGGTDSRDIRTGITDASSIIWEVLDESSCTAVTNQDCANTDDTCTWNQVHAGENYIADTEGQYRLTINYQGGCFNQYYFNVYRNILTPTAVPSDIFCTTPGSIVVNGVPSGYEFSIDGVNYQTSNTFSVTTPGIYTAYVRQIGVSPNPCIFVVPDLIVRERNFNVSTRVLQPLCHDDFGRIIVAANDVRPQYFFSIYQGATLINSVGPIANNNYLFNNLSAGTYTINVSTEDGCVDSRDIDIVAPPELDGSLAITEPLTCTNGQITISAQGGTSPYFYFVNSTTVFQSSPIIDVTTGGTYNVRIVDSNNCSIDRSIVIDAIAPPVFNITETDISCADDPTTGSITINVTNANGNTLRYSIDNGVTYSNSPVFTNVAAGTYDVVVEYVFGTDICETDPQSVTIDAPDTINGTATLTTPYTCAQDGVITVSGVSGGAPPYMYSIDGINFQTGTTFTGLTNGTYTVIIRDANNCDVSLTPIVIDPVDPPTDLDFSHTILSCPANTTTVTLTPSGGTTPLEYQIVTPAAAATGYQSSNVFSGLVPDTYTFRVRDANDCEYTESYTIAPIPALVVDAILTKGLDCSATPDGTITLTVSGGHPAYVTYEVSFNSGAYTTFSPSGNPFLYTVTTDGTYEFRVTDSEGCIAESSVITVNPITDPTATETLVDPTCNGDTNGSVQILPSGASGPYEFSFNGSAFTTTSFYDNLAAGTYPYQVRDANECIFDGSVTLTAPNTLQATASVSPFICDANNISQSATVTVNAPTGGTSPYQYSFNGSGYSATNTLTVSDTGSNQTINWSVRDAQGCIVNGSETLQALNPPTDLNITATSVTCLATTSDVTLTATNGVGTLTYTIEAPASATTNVTGATSGIFTGLLPDTYIFRVTDANGCYYDESFTVTPVTPIAVTGIVISDVLCNGGNTGVIEFTVSGNTGGYTYTLTGTGTDVQSGNTIDYTNLVAGTYTINVTDPTTGCTDSFTATINEPANPLTFTESSTNVFCTNDVSQITVTANGGTPNYTYAAVVSGAPAPALGAYSSSNIIAVDTNSATDLVWDVYVRDVNGCQTMNTVTITSDGLPTLDPIAQQCYDGSNITVTLSGTSLVGPAEYSMGSGYQASPTFTITGPGTYTFSIRDGNNCTATQTLVVEPQLQVSALLTKDLTCSVPTDATIDVTISGGTGTYTAYEVSTNGGATYNPVLPAPSGSSFTYTTSTAGTYQFRITDSNSCQEETTGVTVTAPVNPSITSVTQTANILCNGDSTAAIDVVFDNTLGVPPFVINVNNDTTSTDYGTQTSGLTAGSYTITLTDDNGCTDTETIVISEPDPVNLAYTVDPITCGAGGVSLGRITITSVTGGTPNYSYHVTGVNGYDVERTNQTGASVFEVVDFGLYEIIVTDANGCTDIVQNILVASPPDDLDISVISPPADCSMGGQATVSIGTPLAGSGPFHFAIYTGPGMTYTAPTAAPWQDEMPAGSEQTTFTNLIPGATYTFIVYDEGTMCYHFEVADIPIPTNSTLTTSAVVANNVTCTGSADGNVSFDISSTYPIGTPVTYEIFNSLTLVTTGITGSGTVPANGTLSVPNLGPLPFGDYVVVVTEDAGATNAGCSVATTNFQITESAILLAVTADATRNENCNELGVITATAQHGTGPYEYQAVVTGSGIPATWVSTNSFDLAVGTYDIYVRDAYGCIQFDTETIIRDADPTLAPIPQQCFVGSPFTVTLSGTVSVGPASYSMGGAFQASPTFTISASGTYTFTIRDNNGCTTTEDLIVEPQLQLLAALTKDLDCTVTPDAIITLTPSGGTGTYTGYEVNYNGGGFVAIPGTSYTATAAGTYEFRVTDSQPCTAISNTITIDPLVNPTANETHIDVSCNGGNNGSITVTASGGVGPYEYSNDNGSSFQTSNVFSGLIAATYNIVVRDSKSCISTAVLVTIDEPTAVGGSPTLTQSLSCGTGNATQSAIITVTGSGGTPPYMYSYDGGTNYTTDTTYTTNLAGPVTIFVRDANGCVSPGIIENIPALDPPTDLDFTSAPITCLAPTTDVTLTATDGVGPLGYAILSPASATTNVTGATTGIFTGLAPDTYMFEVTDANGCTYQESYTISPVTNITVSEQLINNVTCNGAGDGAVTFTVGDFAGTYSYTINGGVPVTAQTATTIPLTGLAPATYTIIVTDDTTGCTDTANVIVSEPLPVSLLETANINANCNLGAQVTVTASGGTAPYTYAFVQDGVAPTPGDYTTSDSRVLDPNVNTAWDVYVLDVNGCSDMIDVTITTDPLPSATIPPFASNQCNLTGPYTFTVTSPTGIAPFDYSIDGGVSYQTSPTFAVNVPGIYTVTVRDGNGCTTDIPATIEIYTGLDLTPAITALPSCNDDDGEITVTGSGGSGTYTYSISPNPASITLTGNVFSGVPSGTYTITITDPVTTCTDMAEVFVPEAVPLTFTHSSTPVTCFGDNNGTIEIDISGYTGPYTYEVFDSSSNSVFGTVVGNTSTNPLTINGLVSDNYTVAVTETATPFCTTTSGTITVGGPPSALTLTASETSNVTCDNNAGTIVAVGQGGWGTLEYELTGAATVAYSPNATFSGLSAGNYTVNVRDAGGCIETFDVTLDIPLPINADIAATPSPLLCYGDTDATITVSNVVGGQGSNYSYTLNTVLPTVSSSGPQTSPVFNNVSAGTYNVTITDGYNCSFTTNDVTIIQPTEVEASLVRASSQTCTIDATLTLSAIGGTGPYDYSDTATFTTVIGTFATSTTFSVTPGTYRYYVRDANGCIGTVTNDVAIDPLEMLTLDMDTSHAAVNCEGDLTGTIIADAQGGVGSYVYELQDTLGNAIPATQNSPGVFTDLGIGSYRVYVVSGADCFYTSADVTIAAPSPALQVTPNVTNVSCFGENSGVIEINVVPGTGTGTIKYAISPQLNQFFEEPIFTDLFAGDYQVVVQDELGCFEILDITISEPLPVSMTVVPGSMIPEVCQGDMDGEFSVEISGGTMPYSVAIDDINGPYTTGGATQTQFLFDNLSGGTHLVYIRDAQDCETEWTVNMPDAVLLDPEVEVDYCTDIADATSNTVTVTIDESVDPADVDYSLDGTNFQSSNVFVDVTPGTNLSITVRHTNTCERTVTFDVNQYDPLEIVLNDSQTINTIDAQATGGSGNYEYAVRRVNEIDFEPYQDTGTFIIYESGIYEVTVTDSNGCVASAERYFEYIDVCIPNYFVPRNGGWGPGCTSQYTNMTFDIFDRYGRVIATLGVDDKWDGNYNGRPLPSGDYWYVINLNDPRDDRSFVGHFTLYR